MEFIELLEKVVIEPSTFSDNRDIQNTSALHSIRADKGQSRWMHQQALLNYDAVEIAKIATDHGLYEEALMIYEKYKRPVISISVLVEQIVYIDHDLDYANPSNFARVIAISKHDDLAEPLPPNGS